ncbi:ubiquitin carboxyl-terminal hydrolase [Vairimorpha necatrix]|uniref:Ubiquitin carboxyl-terminal hydrolase n=1 Tax=Vairimorpha necatrix TaxID=6039 RepID=A0AAX4JG75_9MICR
MNFIWKSVPLNIKNPTILECFECQNHKFNTVLLHKNRANYFFIIYKGASYFDINVEYKITINNKIIQGLYQFSQFNNHFGFSLENSSTFDISLEIDIITNYNSKETTSFCGLRNLGASCYFNSLIQPLFLIKKFRNEIYQCEPKGKLLLLQRLFYNMENQECVDTSEFLTNMVKNVTLHQDVHEFSKYLFDVIEEELKKFKSVNKNIWEKLIQGQIVNYIDAECGCTSKVKENFQDIQVSIRDYFTNTQNSKLEDSLGLFTKIETLSGENKYKCDKHGLVNAKKGILFADLPPILFLLLKRFDMDFETGESYKIDDYFEFPEILDFKNFSVENSEISNYKLYSVIVHKGVPSEGHFYSYISLNNQWYKFNDNVVTKVPKEEAIFFNFGGKDPLDDREKDFSAYYLIYLREDFEKNVEINIPELVLEEIKKQNLKKEIRCTTFKNIKNYKGIGFYNPISYSFPLTNYQEYIINEFDTVKALKNKLETDQEAYIFNITGNKFDLLNDDSVLEGKDFFIYKKNENIDFTKKKFFFVKIFKNEIWLPDTFPENLNLSFILVIDKNIRKNIEARMKINDFEIYKEDFFNKKVELLNSQNEENLKNGDILILVEKNHCDVFECFYKDFSNRMCINVLLNEQNCVSLFLPRNMESELLSQKIRSFFSNDEVSVEPLESLVLEYLPLTRNIIFVDIKDNKIIYLGYDDAIDYNSIKHVHPFIIPPNTTFRDFYKVVLSSNYYLPISFQNLHIVDTVKNSLFLEKYSFDEVFTSQGMNIIQDFKSNYLKVAYFTGMYEIKGYPFFLFIDQLTVAEFREKHGITSRLVKYDNRGYKDLDDIDVISEYSPDTFILIERRY